jgi:hypothetical protein
MSLLVPHLQVKLKVHRELERRLVGMAIRGSRQVMVDARGIGYMLMRRRRMIGGLKGAIGRRMRWRVV